MLKVTNFVFRFLQKKILEFCEATKSYTTVFYDKIFLTVVKYLCGKNYMTLHSFFPNSSLYLVSKMKLLNRPLSLFNPCK